MALIAALPTQARFFFLLLPRWVAGRCTTSRLAGYAIELTASGSQRLGMWCWERAILQGTSDVRMCDDVLELCIRAGHHEAAEEFANRFYDTSGMSPAAAIKFAGNLVVTGAFGPALKVYDRLLQHCGEDLPGHSPAPAWDACLDGHELRALLGAHAGAPDVHAGDSAYLESAFARLCFSFGVFDTSARLFEQARTHGELGLKERIAWAYALLRSGRGADIPVEIEEPVASPATASLDSDWHILLATVLFARGATAAAAAAIQAALRARLGSHVDFNRICADCLQIITCISRAPATISFSPAAMTESSSEQPGIRKIFVCGSGWSGSGALYDALSEYEGLAEAPNTPIDRYMNDGTDNEMMFVQGPAGLGRLWRMARDGHELSRIDLWDMFRLHVLGAGAVGYSEHKSGRVASNLIRHFGARYTTAFRAASERFAALSGTSTLSQFRSVLEEITEALSATIAESVGSNGGCRCVIYNNAIFGPNIDMLELFRNAKAAFVVRDPLDQFADRRANDLKHWMTSKLFITFYRGARETFHARMAKLSPEIARDVHEVAFEQFVLDARYRKEIIGRLLEGQAVRRIHHRFDPKYSATNIGIHAKHLAPGERELLDAELKDWRRVQP
jgi:hypothetical protein